MHKDGIWYHVLQSAIGDGKTVVAIGEVLARCWAHRTITHKALYAVPFRRLAREKGDEFRDVFTRLRGTTPRPNEVRVVEGKRPVRDITLTCVVIGTFEHILQYLACAKAMVRTWSGNRMLGEAYKVVIIDEVHMMFDGGRGDLVNEIMCLCRCLRIPVLVLTGTLQQGERRRLAIRLFYRAYGYPCIQNRLATTSIAYARPPRVDYCELIGSRKRKYPQIRRTFAKDTWDRLLVMFGICALTHDDPDGVVVFGHTKAAMEELFMKFVDFVQQNKAVCDRIIKREPLPLAVLPMEAYAAVRLEKLYEAVALGHTLRIAYNHAGVGDAYSETVGDEVTRHQSGAYRVIVCTSTYVAGINIRNVNYVFINGD